jgi:isoaspartyl peptidase/L-asparaginase-like protein (Ntn-hydrolase superfamily)
MEGQDLNAGAIGSFTATKSPIRAARLVMEESRHVFMVGERGEAYVRELGAQAAPQDWFTQGAQAEKESEHGTVGAVVLDRCGTLAAGTSTGGYDAKIPGRIGDSPVIGAGTYADNRGAAVSATGHGEWFIRYAAAHSISAQVRAGQTLDQAARVVISDMAGHGGLGAVIALDADGNFAAPYSTTGVLYAYTDESGSVRAGTRPDEE